MLNMVGSEHNKTHDIYFVCLLGMLNMVGSELERLSKGQYNKFARYVKYGR